MNCLAIIPAYNEEKNIYKVVKAVKDSSFKPDVVVINDGSDDDTESEAQKAGAKVLSLEEPRHWGCRTDWIFVCTL